MSDAPTSWLDRKPVRGVVVTLLVLVFVALATTSMWRKSLTTDELSHIAAGYSYVTTGSYRLNPEHPPLAKLLSGCALLLVGPEFDETWPGWEEALTDTGRQFSLGRRFLYGSSENVAQHRAILFLARVPMVLLGAVLCVYMYLLARLLYGSAGGVVALTLTAFSPIVLAHARLVTTDVPVTAFWVAATYHMIAFSRRGSWGQLCAGGVMSGLALASKYSGVLLALAVGLVSLVSCLLPAAPDDPRLERSARLRGWTVQMVVYAAVVAVTVLAVYRVSEIGWFFRGIRMVWENHDPRYRGYLLGEHDTFLPAYFGVALLVKMPLGTLALAAVGGLWRHRDGNPLSWTERLLLAAPAVLIFVIATTSARYLGVRYVLPCIPLIIILASRVTLIPWARRWPGRFVPIAGGLAVTTSVALAWPDYIPYFNEVVGGSRGGVRVLDDSNIDWGQDWYALATFQRERGIRDLRCLPKNTIDPGPAYGVAVRPMDEEELYLPSTGWYAVSAHVLTRDVVFSHERRIPFDWLDAYSPVAILGGSFYVYRFQVSHAAPPPGFEGTHVTPDRNLEMGIARLERANVDAPSSGTLQRLAGLYLRAERIADVGRAVDRAARQSTASIRATRAELGHLDDLHPSLQRAAVRRYEIETVEMTNCAEHARKTCDPERMLACLDAGLTHVADYSRLPADIRALAPWSGAAAAELRLRRFVPDAWAYRFIRTGDEGDRGQLDQAVAAWNRRAGRRHDPERLDAEVILQEARATWESFRRRSPNGGSSSPLKNSAAA